MASDEVDGPAPGLKWETPAAAPATANGPAPGLTWESAPNVLAFSRRGGMSNPAMQSAPDAPAEPDVVTLGELRDNPKAAIQRIGAIVGKDVTDPKLWLTMAASYFGPKVFSMAAPIVGKAAAGAMRMAPEVVRSGATAAGAYVGGPAGAVVGRTVGEAVAGRMRPQVPEGPISSPGYPRAGSTPAPQPAPVEPPAHLDLSQRVPAGGLTQQQIAERLAATKAQGMTAPQVEPVMAPRPSPSSVPVPEGPPEPSMAGGDNKEPFNAPKMSPSLARQAEIRAAYQTARKAVVEVAQKANLSLRPDQELALVRKVQAGATPEEAIATLASPDAEFAAKYGLPSDAERKWPVNKVGLPSNPPTARKARGKVSDLADMPIEPPKPVEPAGPTAENIASVQAATRKKFSGKIADLTEMLPATQKYAATQAGRAEVLDPEIDYALKWIEQDMEAIPFTKRTVIDHPDKGMGGARLGVGGSAGAKIYRNIVGEEGSEISGAKRGDVLRAIKNLREGKVTPVGELVLGVARDLKGMSIEKLQKLMATPPP